MSYVYLKKSKTPSRVRLNPHHKKILATSFFLGGVSLLILAVFPILSFQIEYSSKFGQIINPLSAKFYNNQSSILGELTTDYTNLNNWFDNQADSNSSDNPLKTYTISIPKLKIDQAVVTLGSMDLKNSLIQYPQTALPGQNGNAVVFGHSVLPQFFNPKSYLTIFSTLYRLKEGDEIFVEFDGIKYKYLVEDMFEVQPTDLSVLEQRFDNRNLSLITCSPPGTYLRRLVIKTRIADY